MKKISPSQILIILLVVLISIPAGIALAKPANPVLPAMADTPQSDHAYIKQLPDLNVAVSSAYGFVDQVITLNTPLCAPDRTVAVAFDGSWSLTAYDHAHPEWIGLTMSFGFDTTSNPITSSNIGASGAGRVAAVAGNNNQGYAINGTSAHSDVLIHSLLGTASNEQLASSPADPLNQPTVVTSLSYINLNHNWTESGSLSGSLRAICYGHQEPKPTPSVTPTPYCTNAVGTYRTVDLLSKGTVTAGSLTANQALIGDVNNYVIDFSMTAPVPQTLDGYNQGFLSIGVDFNGLQNPNESATYIAEVNGQTFTDSTGAGATIPIALGGTNELTIHYHAEVPGAPSTINTMKVVSMSVRLPSYLDPGHNLLCDGGMEQYPGSSYWKLAQPGDFGRLNKAYSTGLENLFNGTAICSAGQQALGPYFRTDGNLWYHGQPIKQHFHWDGGIAQWKFRASAGLGTIAHVWIMDNAGTDVADLYNAGVSSSWSLYTGSLDLDPGDYFIVMDASSNILQTVYYDDVAIGSQIDTECQEDFETLPTVPTPSPSPSGQPTFTVTPTRQLTPYLTGTSTITPTSTTVGTATTTARPTRTATISGMATNTGLPPTRTATPYGTPHAQGTSTPNPNATGTPAVDTPEPGGDYPIGGEPGNGDCSKPVNQWSLAWWMDYEVCRVLYAVSWQPYHSATVVAMPSLIANREPVKSVVQIGNGVRSVQTEIATYTANYSPMVQAGEMPNPNIFKQQPNSPWDGQWKFQFGPQNAPRNSPFSMYCSSKMTSVLGTMLSPGFCWVLNLFRDLGILIWFQFLLYILMGAWTVNNILRTIQFYPLMSAANKPE